ELDGRGEQAAEPVGGRVAALCHVENQVRGAARETGRRLRGARSPLARGEDQPRRRLAPGRPRLVVARPRQQYGAGGPRDCRGADRGPRAATVRRSRRGGQRLAATRRGARSRLWPTHWKQTSIAPPRRCVAPSESAC